MKRSIRKYMALACAVFLLNACSGESSFQSNRVPSTNNGAPAGETQKETRAFYFGNDLSYVNEMEDCGAVYKEEDETKDPFELMEDHGTNLVRVRLWHDPWWQDSVPQAPEVSSDRKQRYSDLADATESLRRAKAAGMDTMLDMHFSDVWADPSRQVIPRAWQEMWGDADALSPIVYDYVTDVLEELDSQGLVPEFIKLGNENNAGLMVHKELEIIATGNATIDLRKKEDSNLDFAYSAALWNSAIQAVRDFSQGYSNPPQITLHIADAQNANGFMEELLSAGVTDFDVIGFSYYYGWHGGSISDVASHLAELKQNFPDYEAMLVETGYAWDTQNIDNLSNIIQVADPEYAPLSQQNQLKYMVDLAQAVKNEGGLGVVFWEPAWVSTPCRTPWGQGSSHEHVAYFDHRDDNNFHIGGTWMEATYLNQPAATVGEQVNFYIDTGSENTSQGVFIRGDFTENTPQPMLYLGKNLYTYTAMLPAGAEGEYQYSLGQAAANGETLSEECGQGDAMNQRRYSVTSGADNIFAFEFNGCRSIDLEDEEPVTVTFNVDMTGVNQEQGVYITGEFNNWIRQAMTLTSDNLYTLQVELEPGTESAYYVLNDPDDWEAREDVPTACEGRWNDRLLVVPQNQRSITVNFAWAACPGDATPPDNNSDNNGEEANTVEVTFQVDMSGQNYPNGVFIAGDMNNWVPTAMQQVNDSDIFELTLTLQAEQPYHYFFVKDENYNEEETVPEECAVEGKNRLFETAGEQQSETVLVAWSSCDATPITPPEEDDNPRQVTVTFQVDMTGQAFPNGVFITGDINNFGATSMSQIPDTNIFTITLSLAAGEVVRYFYMKDPNFNEEETVPEECAVEGNNRSFQASGEQEAETVLVAWSSCDATPIPPEEDNNPRRVTVTFQVDMTGQAFPNGVFITGDINNFGATSMSQIPNTNIFTIT